MAERRTSARSYSGPADMPLLQDFTVAAIRLAGQAGYLHPGDVAHRIYNGLRHETDQAPLIQIWEDDAGIAAWVLVSPKHAGFDAQVRPDRRSADDGLERTVIEWAEVRTRSTLDARTSTATHLVADAFEEDAARIALLEEMGWTRGAEPYVLTLRTLHEIPEVDASGYVVRRVRGIEEAESVGAVHAASFGSVWNRGQYATLMGSPGYAAERELVAENEAGDLCGFTVTWYDTKNKVGLFEPVGVHPDHRRRKLGQALLAAGMRQMAAAGMTRAMVLYEASNPGSGGLYRSMGFEPTWTIWDYLTPR